MVKFGLMAGAECQELMDLLPWWRLFGQQPNHTSSHCPPQSWYSSTSKSLQRAESALAGFFVNCHGGQA